MNRIQAIRQQRGLTQETAATQSGISRSTLSAIENGHIDPGVSVALRIARTLGVTVEALYGAPTRKEAKKPMAADRRAGKVPHVRTKDGGLAPRSRRKDGGWRKKRSDAGKPRRQAKTK
jgi:DNA-binding XRE family transcriptional regulator